MRTHLVALAALAACTPDYGYVEASRTDVFQQRHTREVDLVVVIDNSGSMAEEQENLAVSFDNLVASFSAAEVDWQIAVVTTDVEPDNPERGRFVGGDDELVLRGPAGEIDRVMWDRAWAFEDGVSLQLDPGLLGPTANDDPSAWCPSVSEYVAGSRGTPGAANVACEGANPEPPDPGPDAGPRAPRAGDLVISEIMAESAGLDSACEWFELSSVTDDTLSLDGVTLSDLDRNAFAVQGGVEVPPRGHLVVGRQDHDNCDVPVDLATGDALVLNDDVRIITPDTPDGADVFAENVAQGVVGTGIEMGFEGLRLALSDLGGDAAGFVREGAVLSVLFVTDEDDQSPYPVDAYLRFLKGLKGDAGYRDPNLVKVGAVCGKDPPPRADLPSCESENGFAWYGRRYLEAVAGTLGVAESICEEDFAPIVERVGLTLSGMQADFGLSEYPQLETLEVALYADSDEASKVRDLVRDVDFTYVSDGNLLHFDEAQVPPSGHYVVARYEMLASGAEVE